MNRFNLFFAALVLSSGAGLSQTADTTKELKKDFQLTLITPLGTNGAASSKTINKVSVNIFAGVSKGVDGLELGGFANIVLKNVKGLQWAGFTNVVLGNVTGAQWAGFCNYAGGSCRGAAFAGFGNVSLGGLKGAQFAGFFNTSKDSVTGGQFAGFCNTNLGTLHGAQLAGFCNYNQKEVTGLQAAGFLNVSSGQHKGAQLAGFGNVSTGNVEGLQAAGFFNYAKKVKGTQLGFINIADSVDGASIGFLNLIKKGIHQVEVSGDEVFFTNVSLRTGTYKFYNVFSVGATPKAGNFLWQIGYGAGTSLKINDKLRADISVSAHHVSNGLFYSATSELYKVYAGIEYKVADKCFIAAGPTFNLYWGDALMPDFAGKYSGIAPYSLLNETNSQSFNFKGWVGGRIAIRFL